MQKSQATTEKDTEKKLQWGVGGRKRLGSLSIAWGTLVLVPFLVLPFSSPGDCMAPNIAEYKSDIQPHMCDIIN